RTTSAARSESLLSFPSSSRYSMRIFWPSMYPSARNPCRNASWRGWPVEEPPERTPKRGTLTDWGSAATENVKSRAAEKVTARTKALCVRSVIFFVIQLFCYFSFLLSHCLSDHLICPEQHRLWNCYTDLLCGF